MIRKLGQRSQLIALADPDQRIYEFRGADPERLSDFLTEFSAESTDFSGENHRSNGTDITEFGNDLLSGKNKGRKYQQVEIQTFGFRKNQSTHYRVKLATLNALNRLKKVPEKSVAILVPSKRLMLDVSAYLSCKDDGLPELGHDVAMDAEPPALAAGILAIVLEGGAPGEVASRMLGGLYNHIRGRRGGKVTPQADLDLAGALSNFVASGKVSGAKRKRIVSEVQRIAAERGSMVLSGDPAEDWIQVRRLIGSSPEPTIKLVAEDARFLRLLHRGSSLRTALGQIWRDYSDYRGAGEAVREALVQEHFTAAQKDWRGIHLMTIHKSKGKEFDEVIIYDGAFQRIVRKPDDAALVAQDRLALRVAVTRAIRRATILTPEKDRCLLL